MKNFAFAILYRITIVEAWKPQSLFALNGVPPQKEKTERAFLIRMALLIMKLPVSICFVFAVFIRKIIKAYPIPPVTPSPALDT